jgi:hypothetical protein
MRDSIIYLLSEIVGEEQAKILLNENSQKAELIYKQAFDSHVLEIFNTSKDYIDKVYTDTSSIEDTTYFINKLQRFSDSINYKNKITNNLYRFMLHYQVVLSFTSYLLQGVRLTSIYQISCKYYVLADQFLDKIFQDVSDLGTLLLFRMLFKEMNDLSKDMSSISKQYELPAGSDDAIFQTYDVILNSYLTHARYDVNKAFVKIVPRLKK